MSNYPIWWEQTITIFNKYEDKTTHVIKWYKTVVDNCFWQHSLDRVTIGETVLATDYIICRIPKNNKFLEKYLWLSMPNDQMQDYFTLGRGDIIIRGTVDDEINEYVAGSRSSDVIEKYKDLQGCIEIEEISINTGRGRNNEHYYVKGI